MCYFFLQFFIPIYFLDLLHLPYLECRVVKAEKGRRRKCKWKEWENFLIHLLHLDLPPLALSNSQFPCHLHTKCSLLSELCTLLPLNTKSPQITALFVVSTFGHVSLGCFCEQNLLAWTYVILPFTRQTRDQKYREDCRKVDTSTWPRQARHSDTQGVRESGT